jgi:hypothetical protein
MMRKSDMVVPMRKSRVIQGRHVLKDQTMTKAQLLAEIKVLRQRVKELEASESERLRAEAKKDEIIKKLEDLARFKALRGIMPICSSCKKIRDDKGYWHQLEIYIRDHSDADFSHGICPECKKIIFPELFGDI